MITQEKYALQRVKVYCDWKAKNNEKIRPLALIELINQWEFDYQIEKDHRPEVLEFEMDYDSKWSGEKE
ncbi:hypothetical protein [Aquibacillus saliphilus]|uniref:hypothetical protein n=1 Tax=Aquibacillus saliphilus TaxID=1909422 RepID=UPI001CEFF9C9|nr:hypothetical protein [Aquibacillus saliphilus]